MDWDQLRELDDILNELACKGWRDIQDDPPPPNTYVFLHFEQQGDEMPNGLMLGIGMISEHGKCWIINASDNEKSWPSKWKPLSALYTGFADSLVVSEELERVKAQRNALAEHIEVLLEEDPNASSDCPGATILDQWRHDAIHRLGVGRAVTRSQKGQTNDRS